MALTASSDASPEASSVGQATCLLCHEGVEGRPLEFYHAFKVVFLFTLAGGEARASDETLAVDFFSFDDLPPLSSNRTNERHLAEVRAHLSDPARPAAFD